MLFAIWASTKASSMYGLLDFAEEAVKFLDEVPPTVEEVENLEGEVAVLEVLGEAE